MTLQEIANCIEFPDLREYTTKALDSLSPEFWTAPSSSTGKYHPKHESGEGGLVRHTILCTACAMDALRRYEPTKREHPDEMPAAKAMRSVQWATMRDIVRCAGLLHDGWKNGIPWGNYTKKEHPAIGQQQMLKLAEDFGAAVGKMIETAAYAVAFHYGVWTTPCPVVPLDFVDFDTQAEEAVAALCLQEGDYYASRRWQGTPDWEAVHASICGN